MTGSATDWTLGFLVTQAPAWSKLILRDDAGKAKDHTTALLTRVRSGAGWRPVPRLALYGDAEYLRVGSEGEAMNFGRLSFLGELFPSPVSVLRFGTVVDTAGKVTYNFGIGYYGFKALRVDIGYSHNAFAEVGHEFGTTRYLFLIIGTAF